MEDDDEDNALREKAIETIKQLEPADFLYTVDDWDIYHFPGKPIGTIALRIEELPERRLKIGIFVPFNLTLDEIREALKEDPPPMLN